MHRRTLGQLVPTPLSRPPAHPGSELSEARKVPRLEAPGASFAERPNLRSTQLRRPGGVSKLDGPVPQVATVVESYLADTRPDRAAEAARWW